MGNTDLVAPPPPILEVRVLRRGSLGNLSHGHASGQPAVESGLFSPCGERGTYACWAQCDVYSLVGETKRAGSAGREWCSLSGSRRSEEEASLEDMTWELVGSWVHWQ